MARSVLLYLGLFCVSLVLFATSDDLRERNSADGKKAVSSWFFAFVPILLITLVAAFRGDSVGVDTTVYPDQYLSCARGYSSIFSFFNDPATTPGSEPLNGILVWICSRLSTDKWPLLLFYQLLTVLPVYYALLSLKDRLSPSLGMAVYLFVFYNNSLNMMRQSVACAFLLLAFAFLIADRKFTLRFVLTCAVAALFHKSGLYGIALLLAVSFVANADKSAKKYIAYILILISPVLLNVVLTSLISAGLVSQRVSDYADIFLYKTYDKDWFVNPFGTFSLTYLVIYAGLLFCPRLISLVRDRDRLQENTGVHGLDSSKLKRYLWNLNCSGYLLYAVLLFSFQTVYGIRFSIFFDFLFIISLPLACGLQHDKTKRLTLIIVLAVFWGIWIQVLGWSGSQLYLFSFE